MRTIIGLWLGGLLLLPAGAKAQNGASLYEAGCASCHGADGGGASADRIAFDDPLPDFADCSFASREPDADWIAVAEAGGPVRGFSETMPAFGEAFDGDQLQAILDHIRTFCDDPAWPRGELNLPRPLVTEKAYPEDEAVWTTGVDLEGQGAVLHEIVYERRFGPRSQIEIKLPFGLSEAAEEPGPQGDPGEPEWGAGLGDIAVGFKHAAAHGERSILSLATEIKLPTGDEERGFGADAVRIEPFLALGQVLPGEAFLHAQGGVELSTDTEAAEHEAFLRGVIGRTFTSGEYGRAWSPMVEVLGAVDLEDGSRVQWDLVPQMQVTLNTRQHVMLNLGVRLPVTDAGQRDARLLVYLLWDWFDGGLFDGW
ncbi:MAG: c-type cytochrome [Gemmatimonadota bacterium]|nr:c-type cytochrome [Gemmatimonadota bacterium]